MVNHRSGEKCSYSSEDHPHSRPMVDAEEESTPKAEISDEATTGPHIHILLRCSSQTEERSRPTAEIRDEGTTGPLIHILFDGREAAAEQVEGTSVRNDRERLIHFGNSIVSPEFRSGCIPRLGKSFESSATELNPSEAAARGRPEAHRLVLRIRDQPPTVAAEQTRPSTGPTPPTKHHLEVVTFSGP